MKADAGTAAREALPRSPFVGLANYSEADTKVFFGRKIERQTLIGNLRVSRFTVLYAQSGVGKSSLLRAGVVARLQELAKNNPRRNTPRYVPAICSSWGGDAVENLKHA